MQLTFSYKSFTFRYIHVHPNKSSSFILPDVEQSVAEHSQNVEFCYCKQCYNIAVT